MTGIKEIQELSANILSEKSKVEILTHRITELKKPDSKCEAKLKLVINGNIRGTSNYWLTKSYVLMILKEELCETALRLVELEKQWNAL